MPDIITSMTHLKDLPLYKREKPYIVVMPVQVGFDPENIRTDNLEFESRDGVYITDIRGHEEEFRLMSNGFEVMRHTSTLSGFQVLGDIQAYKTETEEVLKAKFDADKVVCWDVKMRRNHIPIKSTLNIKNPLEVEGPAVSAHVDTTFEYGPSVICKYLPEEAQTQYLKPGKRIQIINTWRTLLPVLEDNPLAVCDYRSVDKNDLISCDRVFPDEAREINYLKYNAAQRWYWLSSMRSDELLLMKMYDTGAGGQANFCPHVSVNNPNASPDAPPRYSVESRSVVIS